MVIDISYKLFYLVLSYVVFCGFFKKFGNISSQSCMMVFVKPDFLFFLFCLVFTKKDGDNLGRI